MKLSTAIPAVIFATLAFWSLKAASISSDEEAIRARFKITERGNYERNLQDAIAMYQKAGARLRVFDLVPPLEDRGFQKAAVDKTKRFFEGTVGPVVVEYQNPEIIVDHDHAYATSFLHFAFTTKDGKKADVTGRVTDVFERIDGSWTVIHEHSSLPTTVGFTW